ncbi:MAG TPA: hypothetical protein VGP40_03855, partial [Chthoniobacterales bacterium]|nr:hypothetical protein [Chthoniobacterales bacterium]
MKRLRHSALRKPQLWIALLCCICTTAVAAPAKKKKSSTPVKRAELVEREPEPSTLPGGVPNTRAAAVIV